MAAADQPKQGAAPAASIPRLKQNKRGTGLWADAWRRLRRNKLALLGGTIILVFVLMAIFAPLIAPYPFDIGIFSEDDTAPTWVTQLFPNMVPVEQGGYITVNENYFLGTDGLGRDLWSRILIGSQVSLMVAFIGPLVSLIVGTLVGLVAGYAGGWVDNLLMRIVDIMYAFPTLLFVILLLAFFRSSVAQPEPGTFSAAIADVDRRTGGMFFVFVGIGITSWMGLARLVRGQILSVREKEYIEAARAMGVGRRGIMFRHMLPNILGPIIVAETLTIPTYISYEAFLSFIGLGVQQPRPSWGSMIAEGSSVISAYPHQAIFPAVALFLVMFAFNFLGDGLRDALDPRMRGVD
ncbi:MAG: ABC transporter permease [bacterium]|nr:ABC transporter permease [bacterium]